MPFAEINTPSDLFDDPHLGAAGLADVYLTDGERRGARAPLPKLPLEMDSRRLELRMDLPRAGQHSRLAAERAGCGPDEIDALFADGVIQEG